VPLVYEMRTYRCMPGRKADVLARFRDHTMALFQKHGIDVVGFWQTAVGEVDDLIYIVRFPSWDEGAKRWRAFQSDPVWQKARDESHARGVIVEHIRTSLLEATDFSPKV